MADIDLDSVPPCPVCGGTLTEHDAREPEGLEGWWGHYDCACGWVLPDQHQRLTYWTIGRWGRTLAQEVARLRGERDEATGEFHRLRARLRHTAHEAGYGRGLTDGAREERAAVVAWLQTDAPARLWADAMGGTELSCAADAIEAGEHRKRTRPTEPPVVVVRRGDP